MRKTRLLFLTALCVSCLAFAGCDDDDDDDDQDNDTSVTDTDDNDTDDDTDDNDTDDDVAEDTDGGDTTDFPAPPTLGTRIDRLGRPGVATALIGTFEADDAAKTTLKNEYNQAASDTWSTYATEIAGNLAIYDSLDTVCGNQLLAAPEDNGTIPADRYATLAGALANDALLVNSAVTTCTTYLGYEASQLLGTADDCGGRTLGYDVIDVTYSALAVGMLSGVGDGVDADDATVSTTFPYLAAPQQ